MCGLNIWSQFSTLVSFLICTRIVARCDEAEIEIIRPASNDLLSISDFREVKIALSGISDPENITLLIFIEGKDESVLDTLVLHERFAWSFDISILVEPDQSFWTMATVDLIDSGEPPILDIVGMSTVSLICRVTLIDHQDKPGVSITSTFSLFKKPSPVSEVYYPVRTKTPSAGNLNLASPAKEASSPAPVPQSAPPNQHGGDVDPTGPPPPPPNDPAPPPRAPDILSPTPSEPFPPASDPPAPAPELDILSPIPGESLPADAFREILIAFRGLAAAAAPAMAITLEPEDPSAAAALEWDDDFTWSWDVNTPATPDLAGLTVSSLFLLASDDASYVTGASLPVDGALSIC